MAAQPQGRTRVAGVPPLRRFAAACFAHYSVGALTLEGVCPVLPIGHRPLECHAEMGGGGGGGGHSPGARGGGRGGVLHFPPERCDGGEGASCMVSHAAVDAAWQKQIQIQNILVTQAELLITRARGLLPPSSRAQVACWQLTEAPSATPPSWTYAASRSLCELRYRGLPRRCG